MHENNASLYTTPQVISPIELYDMFIVKKKLDKYQNKKVLKQALYSTAKLKK